MKFPVFRSTKNTGRSYNGFLTYQHDGVFTSLKDIADNTIDYSNITGKLTR